MQPVAEGAGYIRTADLAIMTLLAKSDIAEGNGCRVIKLTDGSMHDAIGEIIGRATGGAKEAVNRLIDPGILAAKNIEVLLRCAMPCRRQPSLLRSTIRRSEFGEW